MEKGIEREKRSWKKERARKGRKRNEKRRRQRRRRRDNRCNNPSFAYVAFTAEMLKAGLAMRLYTTYQVVCSFLPPPPPPVSMGSVGESGRGRVYVSQREYRAPILEGSLLVPPYI